MYDAELAEQIRRTERLRTEVSDVRSELDRLRAFRDEVRAVVAQWNDTGEDASGAMGTVSDALDRLAAEGTDK